MLGLLSVLLVCLEQLFRFGQWSCVLLIVHISEILTSALCIHGEGCAFLNVGLTICTGVVSGCSVEADCVSAGPLSGQYCWCRYVCSSLNGAV